MVYSVKRKKKSVHMVYSTKKEKEKKKCTYCIISIVS